MQRFIATTSRIAPRSLASLRAARVATTSSTLPALGSRMIAPSTATQYLTSQRNSPLAMFARFLASEAVARQSATEELEQQPATAQIGTESKKADADEYVPVPFADYKDIDANTMRAITNILKFKTASKVQDKIISLMPIKNDIMIKAKTGTGKTTAFLVPAIDVLKRAYEQDPERGRKGRAVGCLVLAKQIAVEANKLATFHGWNVQSLIGGESSRYQINDLARKRSDIVIGTPGRILDFLNNQPIFSSLADKTKLLIFDEADVLLQMGFKKEIDEIIYRMPEDRQTFLVSATMDRKIRELAPTVFKRGFDIIDCVDKGETNTHKNVKQEYITVELSNHFPVICDVIESHIAKCTAENHGAKIVMFMPTTKSTDMYAKLIRSLLRKGVANQNSGGNRFGNRRQPHKRHEPNGEEVVDIMMIHGKMSQDARSRVSERFRKAPIRAGHSSILITTDVSARGVDYPDVSMVLQVGIPTEAESYIHRLGRTGRAGKSGEGVILLTEMETQFLNHLKNLPIKHSEKYTPEYLESIVGFQGGDVAHLAKRWEAAAMYTEADRVQDTFLSLVGFYQGHTELIGNPHGQAVLESSAEILKPFDCPQPPLPRALQDSLGLNRKPRGSRFGNNNNRGNSRFGNNNRSNSRFQQRPTVETADFGKSERKNDYGNRSFGNDRGYSRSRSFGEDGNGSSEGGYRSGQGHSDRPRFNRDGGSSKRSWEQRGKTDEY
ncbi:DEAD-domain-containing protein [Linderina pennispora]|uniref:ATP-dependent RNA helicase n=1 Tax=Linderina pennispora TaxID=61395 RepID=A0A1Y1WKE3_9FUNG|nr:DEAD-domain-containing protein [Linderina pennispora]ORX73798.1 DEAD-domain-containing protein [Linderina pennispora]